VVRAELIRRVLEDAILGHAPVPDSKDAVNVDYCRGREATKAWADEHAKEILRILDGEVD
jgi:hypothetical protein